MRMVLKATVDTEKSGRVLKEGRMQEVLGTVLERLQPEAAYFYGEQGRRNMFFVFDMQDSSQLPPITEPLFNEVGAEVYITPAMNQDDLQKGLQQAFG
ncbi:MAG TPA: hypothetical protein VG455_04275 [Acidimicrobiales bacterium]|nr:hypothetical protein [Acidimicrobiales bacterium]